MRVTFLGTGTSQGIPVIACDCDVCQSTDTRDCRLRTSIMVEHAGRVIVVDTGPDFRQQMLRHHVKRLDAVLFTHEHKDHVAGLDDVRAFNFRQKEKIEIYGTLAVHDALR
ncbi:MAG TPA: MBL fold metallo-hydrolase, partial [Flavobacteriales bacterium]|nr:MBL fold metallo-hydrolase [Flavobacteriales bacterium]